MYGILVLGVELSADRQPCTAGAAVHDLVWAGWRHSISRLNFEELKIRIGMSRISCSVSSALSLQTRDWMVFLSPMSKHAEVRVLPRTVGAKHPGQGYTKLLFRQRGKSKERAIGGPGVIHLLSD